MPKKEDVHKMRVQILNLRSAGLACATAIQHFPPCGRPGGDHLQCPEARAAMQKIYEDMRDLMLSARLALTAALNPNPEGWDFLWWLAEKSPCAENDMAKFGETIYPDQEEFIRIWGELDSERAEQMGSGFSEAEWDALKGKKAWQNARRLPELLHLLKYLEDQVAKQFDLFDSVLNSGLLGDCNVGKWAANKAASV